VKDIFENVAALEALIEAHKNKLVNECPEFNTIDAFRLIDEAGQGNVNLQEIGDFISQNFVDFEFDEDDLNLLIQRFDKGDRNTIKYSEFCTAFAPINQSAQQKLGQRIPQNTQLEKTYENLFSPHTKSMYEQTWKLHFESERLIEYMRSKLLSNPYFDLNKSYYEDLDADKDSCVNAQDVSTKQ
jgi:hypothetical protein